jgi:hypothetical protein
MEWTCGECHANAALMSAAPELLIVAMTLDFFQKNYQQKTDGVLMPGNEKYMNELMKIVVVARKAISKALNTER